MHFSRHLVLAVLTAALVAPPAALEQAALQERALTVNGIQMHYRMVGEGPPLVLLHYF